MERAQLLLGRKWDKMIMVASSQSWETEDFRIHEYLKRMDSLWFWWEEFGSILGHQLSIVLKKTIEQLCSTYVIIMGGRSRSWYLDVSFSAGFTFSAVFGLCHVERLKFIRKLTSFIGLNNQKPGFKAALAGRSMSPKSRELEREAPNSILPKSAPHLLGRFHTHWVC